MSFNDRLFIFLISSIKFNWFFVFIGDTRPKVENLTHPTGHIRGLANLLFWECLFFCQYSFWFYFHFFGKLFIFSMNPSKSCPILLSNPLCTLHPIIASQVSYYCYLPFFTSHHRVLAIDKFSHQYNFVHVLIRTSNDVLTSLQPNIDYFQSEF